MPEPFKNLISADVAVFLGDRVYGVYPAFKRKRYLAACLPHLEALELKQRAALLADSLRAELPSDPAQAMSILLRAVESIPPVGQDELQSGWPMFALNLLAAKYGLEAYEESMALLKAVTRRFTAEFGIRPFLIHRPKETLRLLKDWAKDPDPHVRRLVSEGTRPRLPWGEQIKAFVADPRPILPLLEMLKNDPEEYVRRSVANNLNDISKDHPDLMLDTVEPWLRQATKERQRLVRHACRTLIKSGHARCLAMLGHGPASLAKTRLRLSPSQLPLGERLEISATLVSTSDLDQSLVIDYRFHFVKANGQSAPKVFKGSQLTLAPGARVALLQRFHLRPVSTRKYYSGATRVELLANGQVVAKATFTLVC